MYKEAVEFTAYVCKQYNFDPYGTVSYAGRTVPVITCHQDAYRKQLGCDHDDVLTWFKMYGKTMQNVRDDVYKILHSETKHYYVDIGSYSKKSEAEKMQSALKTLGTDSVIITK